MKFSVVFLSFLFLFSGLYAQNKHSGTTMYPSYKNLVMSGYQGWFRTPDDSSPANTYVHYGKSGKFDDRHCNIDIWPDVSEYKQTYPVDFRMPDGTQGRVFSSYDESTVDLHFQWMQEYGIDGIFVQRFFDYTRTPERRESSSVILKHALKAASGHGRAIAVMYDLSGLKGSGEDCSTLMEDWKFLVDELKATNQPGNKTYLHHNGKPVVALWGIGFPDRPYNIRNIGVDRLIDFLKNDPEYGGCTVMLGIPTFWRELNADCIPDPYLHDIIKQADIILPWMVQRFTPLLHNDMDRYRDVILEDIKWCRKENIDYVPCVCPGFSWHNLSKIQFPDDIKPVGSIPRQGGRFFWQQLSTAILSGAQMLYIAMFDELDEATAIFKCSDTPPVSQEAGFITMDGKPSDWYLWLTGEAGKMLRKEKPLLMEMPERK